MGMRMKKMHNLFCRSQDRGKLVEVSLFWENSQDKNQDNNNLNKASSS